MELRNADRVKVACLAQLVNVIAPILTNASGLLRQTIYYPYSWALQFARGNVLNVALESPTYEITGFGQVPYLDVAGTTSAEDVKTALFVLNRDLAKGHQLEVVWRDRSGMRVLDSMVLTGNDLKTVNSFETPDKVIPRKLEKPSTKRWPRHIRSTPALLVRDSPERINLTNGAR